MSEMVYQLLGALEVNTNTASNTRVSWKLFILVKYVKRDESIGLAFKFLF